MSSITPPKALVPTKMGSNPSRPVLENGNDGAAKATRCTTLSLSSGAAGGASNGHSMVIFRMAHTMTVRGMSRYRRIRQGYWSLMAKESTVFKGVTFAKIKRCLKYGFCGFR